MIEDTPIGELFDRASIDLGLEEAREVKLLVCRIFAV
jgi:hypothetical protein